MCYWYKLVLLIWHHQIFCVTGPLWGESTGHQWIPLTKVSDAELWCFLWSTPWINGWINNREAGDLRHYRTHYDVIVMRSHCSISKLFISHRDRELQPYMYAIFKWYLGIEKQKNKAYWAVSFTDYNSAYGLICLWCSSLCTGTHLA